MSSCRARGTLDNRTILFFVESKGFVPRARSSAKQLGWHTFRRTYATLLKSSGADLKVVQESFVLSTNALK
jgi:site-specific recombinase XerD